MASRAAAWKARPPRAQADLSARRTGRTLVGGRTTPSTLRRAAGRQAAVLNRLIDSHFKHPEHDTQKLMELLGHTPFEVFIGASLGVFSVLLWNRMYPL